MKRERLITRQKQNRIRLLIAFGAILSLSAALIVKVLCFPGIAFDSIGWQSGEFIGVRQQMADRMIARGSLDGMTRDDVFEMLGPPLRRQRPDFAEEWDICYRLGWDRGLIDRDSSLLFMDDSEFLVIRFDEADQVAAYRIAVP